MPKVELYGKDRVPTRVSRAPAASTVQIADTSTPIVQGLSNLQAGIQTAKNELDDTQAEEALVNFEREKNDLFFNPDSGYFNSQGKDAYSGAQGINDELTKLQIKYSDTLTSGEARKKYNTASNVHVTRAQASIGQHASTGMKKYQNDTIDARVENTIETAVLHFNDDGELQLQLKVGLAAVHSRADIAGATGDVRAEMIETYESAFITATINSAMTQDLGRANELMGRLGDKLEGPDALVVSTNLRKANLDADTLTISAQVMGAGNKTLEDIVGEVNEMPTDTPEQIELRGAVMKQVKAQHTLNKTIREDNQRETYEGYGKKIQDGNGQFTTKNIPGMDWETMTVTQREGLQKLEKDNDSNNHDQSLFIDLSLLDDDDMRKLDPNKYVGRIDKAHREKLAALVRKARSPGSKVKTNTRTRSQITKDAIFNITRENPTDYNSNQRVRANALHAELDERIEREIAANGGEDLDTKQLNEIAADFSRQSVLEKAYWFDGKLDVTDVPPDLIGQISDLLIGQGIVVNNDTISQFYADNEDNF